MKAPFVGGVERFFCPHKNVEDVAESYYLRPTCGGKPYYGLPGVFRDQSHREFQMGLWPL